MSNLDPRRLIFRFGLTTAELSVHLPQGTKALSKVSSYVASYQGRQLPPKGWKAWSNLWNLDKEKTLIKTYQLGNNIPRTAKLCRVSSVETARILHSIGKLREEDSHVWRGSKIMTWSLLDKCVKLLAAGENASSISRRVGIPRISVAVAVKSVGKSLKLKRPHSERDKAIKLYREGIVPKKMKDHGVTASWPAVYKWLQESGELGHFRRNTREDLRKIIAKSKFTPARWSAFSRLTRRLTDQTYNKYTDKLDPKRKRGMDWHLDHKVSVYRAFLYGWTPAETAARSNLQLLPALENAKKHTKEFHCGQN
jgi:hypothetical protein